MADHFEHGIGIVNLDSGSARKPDPGFIKVFARQDRLFGIRDDGSEVELTPQPMKVVYIDTFTNSSGQWSVDYSGLFSSVEFVTPVAIRETGDIGEQAFATLHRFDAASANGRVLESNLIASVLVGGGQGLEYVPANVRVRVKVEGYE